MFIFDFVFSLLFLSHYYPMVLLHLSVKHFELFLCLAYLPQVVCLFPLDPYYFYIFMFARWLIMFIIIITIVFFVIVIIINTTTIITTTFTAVCYLYRFRTLVWSFWVRKKIKKIEWNFSYNYVLNCIIYRMIFYPNLHETNYMHT